MGPCTLIKFLWRILVIGKQSAMNRLFSVISSNSEKTHQNKNNYTKWLIIQLFLSKRGEAKRKKNTDKGIIV